MPSGIANAQQHSPSLHILLLACLERFDCLHQIMNWFECHFCNRQMAMLTRTRLEHITKHRSNILIVLLAVVLDGLSCQCLRHHLGIATCMPSKRCQNHLTLFCVFFADCNCLLFCRNSFAISVHSISGVAIFAKHVCYLFCRPLFFWKALAICFARPYFSKERLLFCLVLCMFLESACYFVCCCLFSGHFLQKRVQAHELWKIHLKRILNRF